MTKAEADDLVTAVLQELWKQHRKPVLGSRLKAAVSERARQSSAEFDERGLGYKSFAEYLGAHPGVILQLSRPGGDIRVVPVLSSTGMGAAWIRPDFWRAFVYPPTATSGAHRAYDPIADTVFTGSITDAPVSGLVIEPVPRALQLEWRKQFLESTGPTAATHPIDFTARSAFKDFTGALRTRPDLQQRWNIEFAKHVVDYIDEWGKRHDLPRERWLAKTQRLPQDVRRAVYDMLDSLSVEELLELKVPMKWFFRDRSHPIE